MGLWGQASSEPLKATIAYSVRMYVSMDVRLEGQAFELCCLASLLYDGAMHRFLRAPILGVLVLGLAACSAGEVKNEEGSDGGGGGGSGDGGGGGGPVDGEPTALQGITAAHNMVRSAHGVADITWDNDLAAVAKAWADGCDWGHNAGRSDDYPGYVGENLYGASFVPSGAEVVASWASEEADYNYANNSCSGVCGHYTQVVWANSTKLGCAIANCPNGQVANYVVCNYSPGGNFNGEKPY